MATNSTAMQDSGSNYQFYDKKLEPNIDSSKFICTYNNAFTCDVGTLVPSRFFFYQPNEFHTLTHDTKIRMPNNPVVPMMSRLRVFTNTYRCSFSQLWAKAGTFFTKGYLGSTVGIVPYFTFDSSLIPNYAALRALFARGQLFDMLSYTLPYKFLDTTAYPDDTSVPSSVLAVLEFPLMPLMMYWRIIRDYWLPRNLLETPENYFPDDDAEFRLTGAIAADYVLKANTVDTDCFLIDSGSWSDGVFTTQKTENFTLPKTWLQLCYRPWTDDYFTTATWSPQRGEAPTVDLFGEWSNLKIGLTSDNGAFIPIGLYGRSSTDGSVFGSLYSDSSILDSAYSPNVVNGQAVNFGSVRTISDSDIVAGGPTGIRSLTIGSGSSTFAPLPTNLNASTLRNLFAQQVILEKSMRTDGSYREWGLTFFGKKPDTAVDFRPIYVGGDYQPIVITEVVQQSFSDSSPLGRQAGHGMSSLDGYIGEFSTDEFGFCMSLTCVVPDTYYSQGFPRWLSYRVQEDFPLPERMALGQQAILNKELFVSGDLGIDNDLFGYQDAFDELRYRPNEVHGAVADPAQLSFFPMVNSRLFTETPTLSLNFALMSKDNLRSDWLNNIYDPAFIFNVNNGDIAIKPMPYKSRPEGL